MQLPVQIFKALADDTRLRILALLLLEPELCVCDIIAALGLPQSTVSRHLAYLRKSGLVNDRRSGLWMYYSIAKRKDVFQDGLLAFLKEHVAALPGAAAARAPLEGIGKDDRCD